jgi:hypothetical protein
VETHLAANDQSIDLPPKDEGPVKRLLRLAENALLLRATDGRCYAQTVEREILHTHNPMAEGQLCHQHQAEQNTKMRKSNAGKPMSTVRRSSCRLEMRRHAQPTGSKADPQSTQTGQKRRHT